MRVEGKQGQERNMEIGCVFVHVCLYNMPYQIHIHMMPCGKVHTRCADILFMHENGARLTQWPKF